MRVRKRVCPSNLINLILSASLVHPFSNALLSPLHMDCATLKREHSTDDEGFDNKKSKTPSIDSPPGDMSSIHNNEYPTLLATLQETAIPLQALIPCIGGPPKSVVREKEFLTLGMHQFPIKPSSIQKRKQLFREQDPVSIDLILDMIVMSNFDFTSFIEDPLHQTEVTERDKNILTSSLLYLLVGQDGNLVSSWPSQLPPLPDNVSERWKTLCEKRTFPEHHNKSHKLASYIQKLTLKSVEQSEIDDEVRRVRHKNIKSHSSSSTS